MEDMMEVVGVNLLEAVDVDGGQSYVEARSKCHSCPCKEGCKEWLAEHRQGQPQPFCPNAGFFRSLKNSGG